MARHGIAMLAGGLVLVACSSGSWRSLPAAPSPTVAGLDAPVIAGSTVVPAGGGSGAAVRLVENLARQAYAVPGVSAGEIRSYLNTNGPMAAADSRRYDGVTNWSLQGTFHFQSGPAGCSLADAALELDITIVTPELATPDQLPPETLARWQRYVAALGTHEQGHVDRELAGATELKSTFEQAASAANCTDLRQALNVLRDQEVDKIKAADARYDLETNHGRTQGAVFP